MFREAYAPGVSFFAPAKVVQKSGMLCEITADSKNCFNSYILWMPENDGLENIIVNIYFYYHWRWGQFQKMEKITKSSARVGSRSERNCGSSDPYIRIADDEWNKGVQNIVKKKLSTGAARPRPSRTQYLMHGEVAHERFCRQNGLDYSTGY